MKNGMHLFYDTKADSGCIIDRNIAFYEPLAKGGMGLIVATSGPLIDGDAPWFRIDRDEYIPGFNKLTDAIHKHGCPAFVQLFHFGPMSPLFFKHLWEELLLPFQKANRHDRILKSQGN